MELLQKHFDTALESPDGIKKLRELILTLAMQGKLVNQDLKDQPASELLKEIQAEKERLIKEGKIKKQKELPPIKPEEVPYEVPEGWVWTRLGDISSVQTGKKDVNEGHENGQYPFFSCAQIPLKSNEFSFDTEALLLPGNGANVGQVNYYNGKFEAYQRTYILSDFFPDTIIFVQRTLEARFLKSLEGKQYGSAINYIKLGSLTDFLVPLPPLAEQKRIVAKINELMALCDKLEAQRNARNDKRLAVHTAAINRLLTAAEKNDFDAAWQFITRHFDPLYSVKENVAELKKAILTLAMQGKLVKQNPKDQPASELLKEIQAEKERLVKEDKIKKQKELPPIKPEEVPYEVPSGWVWIVLGNVTSLITKGSTPTSYGYSFQDEGIPFIKVENVKKGSIQFTEKMQFISEEVHVFQKRSQLEANDLLFSIAGTIGETCVVKDSDLPANINQALAIIRGYNQVFTTNFLINALNSIVSEKIKSRARGAAMYNISLGDISEMQIPLPPLAEQKRIVAKIDELMALCNKLESQIDQATTKQTALFDAVLAKV